MTASLTLCRINRSIGWRSSLIGALAALTLGMGFGAPRSSLATEPAQSKAEAPKPFKRSAAAQHRLTGVWRSITENGSSLHPGVMTFEANGHVSVAPDGYYPLIGIWHASSHEIEITVKDRGSARLTYEITGNPAVLALHYDANVVQHFTQQPASSKGTP